MYHDIIRGGTISRRCIVRYGCSCNHMAYTIPIELSSNRKIIIVILGIFNCYSFTSMKFAHHPGHIHRTPGDNWPMLRL